MGSRILLIVALAGSFAAFPLLFFFSLDWFSILFSIFLNSFFYYALSMAMLDMESADPTPLLPGLYTRYPSTRIILKSLTKALAIGSSSC